MFDLKFLLLTAALTAAHPHHHHHSGECMEMRSMARDGKTQMVSHPLRCLKGIKLPREERLAMKFCRHKAHSYMLTFFKGDKIDESMKKNNLEEVKSVKEEFFAKCMVDRLGLKAADGSLDMAKVLKNIVKIESSDISALMTMQTMMTICVRNSTGANATEQFISMRTCIHQVMKDYCSLHQGLLQSYLQRGSDESACANVSTVYEDSMIEELFKTCMTEQAVRAAKELAGVPEFSSSSKGRFAQTMLTSTICVAEKMGWFSEEETGFNAPIYRDFVANFTGWDNDFHVMNEVVNAMDDCESEFTEDDIYSQLHQWKICFAPKIVDICGFNNNITKFFFPFINADVQKAALEYIEEMMDSSIEYMDDDDDIYYEYGEYHDEYDGADDYDYHEDEFYDSVEKGEVSMMDDGLRTDDTIETTNEADEYAMLVDDDDDDDIDDHKSLEDDAEAIKPAQIKIPSEPPKFTIEDSPPKVKLDMDSVEEVTDSSETDKSDEVTDITP